MEALGRGVSVIGTLLAVLGGGYLLFGLENTGS